MVKLIVITEEGKVAHERERAVWMLRNGADRLHLRKPSWSQEDVRAWLCAMPSSCLRQITVHNHVEMACEMPIGGVHVNGNVSWEKVKDVMRKRPKTWEELMVSVSCHSLREVAENERMADYAFLSPVFDSVSKDGYTSKFDGETLSRARKEGLVNEKVMALGGVTLERIGKVRSYGFGGVAMIGGAWRRSEEDFLRMVALCRGDVLD